MFTLQQINDAHSKVLTGADFPKYINDIKTLGVTSFETWVVDSHTQYFGNDDFTITSPAQYEPLAIDNVCNKEIFTVYLKSHQQGYTDYVSFCNHCAETGIEKWVMCLQKMTCTYYDKANNIVLVESLPNIDI
jgi:uncharacterized protein YbcV (DUF1398 family)